MVNIIQIIHITVTFKIPANLVNSALKFKTFSGNFSLVLVIISISYDNILVMRSGNMETSLKHIPTRNSTQIIKQINRQTDRPSEQLNLDINLEVNTSIIVSNNFSLHIPVVH